MQAISSIPNTSVRSSNTTTFDEQINGIIIQSGATSQWELVRKSYSTCPRILIEHVFFAAHSTDFTSWADFGSWDNAKTIVRLYSNLRCTMCLRSCSGHRRYTTFGESLTELYSRTGSTDTRRSSTPLPIQQP